jgi:hypothetical protein
MRTFVFVTVFVVALVIGLTASVAIHETEPNVNWNEKLQELLTSTIQPAAPAPSANAALSWPPRVGEAYPDLELSDLNGDPVKLSKFRGQAFIIEPVGVTCRGCQAFAGGQQVGGFSGYEPQAGLESFPEYFQQLTGLRFEEQPLLLIQIVFYGRDGGAPTLQEAQAWERHFAAVAPKNTIVLFADQAMIRPETRSMIPGFQLVDEHFILVSDTGNPPRQSVYEELIPLAKQIVTGG